MSAIEVKKANQKWKSIYLENLSIKRKEKLNELLDSREEFINYKDMDKLNFLLSHIFELSLNNDDEVILVLESIGVGKIVTKFFVDANKIFDDLDRFYEESIYLFPYELIWEYYKAISQLFFVKQLAAQYKMDSDKELNKLRRREKNTTLKKSEKQDLDSLKKLNQKVKQEDLDLRILIKKDSVSSTIRKNYNKPHKTIIYNFFITFKRFNLASPIDEKNMRSFYCDFYDLMKILSRDKTFLNDKEGSDVRDNYKTIELFKENRVKSLLKLKGYGTYE